MTATKARKARTIGISAGRAIVARSTATFGVAAQRIWRVLESFASTRYRGGGAISRDFAAGIILCAMRWSRAYARSTRILTFIRK